MAGKAQKGKGSGRFTFEEKLALMQRLDAGETQETLGEEAGVTRQYISLLWKKYKAGGPEALHPRLRGRKQRPKPTPEEYLELRAVLETGGPAAHDLSDDPKQPWTLGLVQAYIKRRWNYDTVRLDIIPKLREWGIRYATMEPVRPEDFGPDFVRYINSPIAKQIAEREKEYLQRWQEEAEARKPKRGRPKKQPDPAEAANEIDTSPDEEFDPDVDYVKLLAETRKAQALPPAPGIRTGKHRPKSNRTKPKKRKRK